GSSFSDLQWVIDAYALGLAALLLTWGGIADQIGRKKVFLIGLAGFTVASLLCALSTTPLMLNLARGLQGLAAAAMFATSLALLASTFHGKERGTAIGIWGATTGAAVAIGPVVGGVLLEVATWHWIFLVNLPIGLIAMAIAWRTVHESKNPHAKGLDLPGAVTFSLGLFLLIFGLVRGNAEGWGSAIIVASLGAGLALIVAFLVIESRSPKAMFDLTLFRNRSFVGVSIAAFSLSAGMFALFLYITLWLQNSLALSPLEAGVRILPLTLLSFFAAPIAGRLSSRISPGILIAVGLGLVGVGVLTLRMVDASSEWTAMLPGFILCGLGIGITNPPLAATAVGVVDVRRAGMASGINNTFRQVGIAMGTAAFGALMAALMEKNYVDRLTGGGTLQMLPPEVSGDVLTQAPPQLIQHLGRAEFVGAYTDSLDTVFLIAGILALVAAALCAVLIRKSDITAAAALSHGQPGGAPAGPGEAGAKGGEPEAPVPAVG
ncbi:MAG: MFS transporter, partial [Solirubrobacteraceae bacterium]|nr:MFS transporter [Solirubrobacteraceae bacterium]